jgi:hypothetical protein
VQPRGFALAVVDLRLAIPGQIPERTDRLGRHEARPEQPCLEQQLNPSLTSQLGGVVLRGPAWQGWRFTVAIGPGKTIITLNSRPRHCR